MSRAGKDRAINVNIVSYFILIISQLKKLAIDLKTGFEFFSIVASTATWQSLIK